MNGPIIVPMDRPMDGLRINDASKNTGYNVEEWHIGPAYAFQFPFLEASSHLYNRVCPSVCRSVRRLVTLSSKTREINIFEQIVDRGGILGLPDAPAHLYKTVYPCIGLSIHRSVCQAPVNIIFNKSKLE